ncbi:hypothetical protein F5Y18DRAFT_436380 [Xylariaceae sp. FL1019]|nr:hypothetical protein F5Y18DRAFT_436380 [Xylariaceae sp. FL1019]
MCSSHPFPQPPQLPPLFQQASPTLLVGSCELTIEKESTRIFNDQDLKQLEDPRIDQLRAALEELFKHGISKAQEKGTIEVDTDQDLVINLSICRFRARVWQMKDIHYRDKKSYNQAARAKCVDQASEHKMTEIEPKMGRGVQNFLMALSIQEGQAPPIPMFHVTKKNPRPTENRKNWYKDLRTEACRRFWVKTTRQQRDHWRSMANNPPHELSHLIEEIEVGDRSRTTDSFWTYQRDEAAAADPKIYKAWDEDIIILFDKHSKPLLCRFTGLFRFLYGNSMNKVDHAVRTWSKMPPLPIPATSRHAVDDFIRQKHPEQDLEKAESIEEIYQRHQCVVHYGTWARKMEHLDPILMYCREVLTLPDGVEKGHENPDHIFKTPDTLFRRATTERECFMLVDQGFSTFREKVLGLGSEVARYLFQMMAPEEYEECCRVYNALPEESRMKISEPTFATLAVLGINTFTQRHVDRTDVKFGFASLVALGDYTGGDICFPQIGLKMPYKAGDCVLFRGAEMDHFVSDWAGYRIFLLFTNHQPVRRWAYRKMGKLPPKRNDDWHPDAVKARQEGLKHPYKPETTTNTGTSRYSPCIMSLLKPDSEVLTNEEKWGPILEDSSDEHSTISEGDPSEDIAEKFARWETNV